MYNTVISVIIFFFSLHKLNGVIITKAMYNKMVGRLAYFTIQMRAVHYAVMSHFNRSLELTLWQVYHHIYF